MNHEARRKTLGASEISAACGRSRYQTRADLWELKTGRRKPFEGNASTDIGNWLEEPMAQWYAAHNPNVAKIEPMQTLRFDGRPWSATPDRLVTGKDGAKWLLQIKTGKDDEEWGPDGSLEIPREYYDQIMWELFVADRNGYRLTHTEVAVFFKGNVPDTSRRRIYSFARDPEHIDKLLTGAEEFWGYVERDERPPDPPKPETRIIPANSEIDELIRAINMNKGEVESLERVIEEQRKALMGLVPEGCSVRSDKGTAGWSERKPRPVTDWESVARHMAADLAADLCESSSDPKAATPESVLAEYTGKHTTVAPARLVFTVRGKK